MFQVHDGGLRGSASHPEELRAGDQDQRAGAGAQRRRGHLPGRALPQMHQVLRKPAPNQILPPETADAAGPPRNNFQGTGDYDAGAGQLN